MKHVNCRLRLSELKGVPPSIHSFSRSNSISSGKSLEVREKDERDRFGKNSFVALAGKNMEIVRECYVGPGGVAESLVAEASRDYKN